MIPTTTARRRRADPHAQIHLPPLTAKEALLLANLLDRAIAALWRTHGHPMADLLARLDLDTPEKADLAHSQIAIADGDRDDDEIF